MQTFDKETFKKSIIDNVKNQYRKTIDEATPQQVYQAVAYAVKDVIIDEWIATHKAYDRDDAKIVYYLSMEFLMGRALGNNIINIGAQKEIKEALEELGFDLNAIEDQEPDPRLETGASEGSPPAFWIPWRLWVIRPTAAASATTTACSNRRLKTVTSWRCRTSG